MKILLIMVMGSLMLVGCSSAPKMDYSRLPTMDQLPKVDDDVAVQIQKQGYYMSTNYTVRVIVVKYR